MTDLATLELHAFTPLIGETFHIATESGDLELVLREAAPLGKAVRQGGAFSLVFSGAENTPLAQQLCPIRHESLGELQLFLVPIGPCADGLGYEAVFT